MRSHACTGLPLIFLNWFQCCKCFFRISISAGRWKIVFLQKALKPHLFCPCPPFPHSSNPPPPFPPFLSSLSLATSQSAVSSDEWKSSGSREVRATRRSSQTWSLSFLPQCNECDGLLLLPQVLPGYGNAIKLSNSISLLSFTARRMWQFCMIFAHACREIMATRWSSWFHSLSSHLKCYEF